MPKHSHKLVEDYDGLVGFGYDRDVNEKTITYYMQKFSDDALMALINPRISDEDMEDLFNRVGGLLKKYLTEEEYHEYFLKEDD